MATYTLSDLINASTLQSILDLLAGIYDRAKTPLGDSTESLTTTINNVGGMTATQTSITLTAPSSGSWQDHLPFAGTVQIDNEKLTYGSVLGNVLNNLTRATNGTLAASHLNGATVYLPASVSRYAKQISETIVGDGSTLYGVGESAGWVIRNLFAPFDDQTELFLYTQALQTLCSEYFQGLDQHIAQVAPNVITQPVPTSFGSITLTSFLNYLRYLDDPTSGTAYALLCPWQTAYLYWLRSGGYVLNNKTVFPPLTTLANGSVTNGGVATITRGTPVNRYGVNDVTTWTQGYAACAIRARVTQAGNGTASITANCAGMDGLGYYYGRPATAAFVFSGVAAGDTVVINGHTFTAISGTSNPSPNPSDQFAVALTDAAAANNLAAAINASTNALIAGLISAASDGISKVTLSQVSATDTTAYLLVAGPAHVTVSAGTQTGLGTATFGGGAGIDPDQTGMGPGADSNVTGLPSTQDNQRPFTGTLDLSAVGNIVLLSHLSGSDRALDVITATATTAGVTTGSTFVIETVVERITP